MKINGFRLGSKAPRPENPIRKKRRLKYIAVLPSFITLINGVCGLLAIFLVSRDSGINSFSLPGFLIFLAMLADLLDGRVARLTRTTSSFGGQLDSLCDAISFGVAPVYLMIKIAELHILKLNFLRFPLLIERIIIFSAIFYAICTVLRLARFNVENIEDESAHMSFTGLPSPAAAGVVASFVVFHQELLSIISGADSRVFYLFDLLSIIVLPVATFCAGILMVSRIRYPHVANRLFRKKKSLPVFIAFFAAVLFCIWNIQTVLVICFNGFALSGVIRWITGSLFRKPPLTGEQPLNT